MITLGSTPPSTEREPLFDLDGVTYTVLKEIPGGWTIEALKILAERGEPACALWSLQTYLGDEAIEALRTSPSVSRKDIERLSKIVMTKFVGPAEGAGKG